MDELKVGDLVYAFHKGVHRLVEIQQRVDKNPLAHYVQVLDANYKPMTSGTLVCDIGHCRKLDIDAEYEVEIKAAKSKHTRLQKLER